jgi:Tfp pilus assembly protein PilV
MKSFFSHLPLQPKPSLRLPRASAFSLTEVVIAMGVAAVAFTSIIALFPLGLGMSKESYEATQAALIAQTILADLKDALNGGSAVKLIQKGGAANVFTSANYTSINLSGNTSTTYYLGYDQQPRSDSAGSPIILRPYIFSSSLPAWYTDGTNTATLIVRVIVEKTYVLGASSASNPQKVEVSVESPGNAKATNRIQRVFPGVINQS